MDVKQELIKIAKDLQAYGEEELEGKHVRIKWKWNTLLVQELPVKGKKRLDRLYYNISPWVMANGRGSLGGKENLLIVDNLIKINKNDTFDGIKRNLAKALEKAHEEIEEASGESWNPHALYSLNISDVYYLEVPPSDIKPIYRENGNISLSAEWTEFTFTISYSDNPHDPSYTKYVSSSPKSARDFYKILQADPSILKKPT